MELTAYAIMARGTRRWSDRFIRNIRMQLELAKEVAHRLEIARDQRTLATLEELLRQELKLKLLDLSSLQRTIAWQESRPLWLSKGDVPIKFSMPMPMLIFISILSICWNMKG
jgi:hypothetical protein